MKTRKLLILAVLVLCSVVGPAVSAQTNARPVTEAVEKLRKAMIDPTDAALQALAADKLSYGHSNGKIEDKAEFIRALVSSESDFKTITLTDQAVTVVDNTAMVRHTLSAETANKGVAGSAHLAVLLVWINQNGAWKLLARQAVKI